MKIKEIMNCIVNIITAKFPKEEKGYRDYANGLNENKDYFALIIFALTLVDDGHEIEDVSHKVKAIQKRIKSLRDKNYEPMQITEIITREMKKVA